MNLNNEKRQINNKNRHVPPESIKYASSVASADEHFADESAGAAFQETEPVAATKAAAAKLVLSKCERKGFVFLSTAAHCYHRRARFAKKAW